MRYRNGFTAAELLMVVSIVGLVSAFGFPRLSQAREESARNSAKGYVATYIATARAAAIQHSRTARFNTTGNALWVTVRNAAGTDVTIAGPTQLDSLYDVSLESTVTSIAFDPRGLATALPTEGATFTLRRGDAQEVICVTRMGMVRVEGCGS